jgi:hypothetical protein
MFEDQYKQIAAFQAMLIGEIPERTEFFDQDNIGKLTKDHGIPAEASMVVGVLLEFAALAYWKETQRSKREYSEHRKDLDKLEKAAARMVAVLDELDPESVQVMHEARVARGFRDHEIGTIVDAFVQSVTTPDTAPPPNQLDVPHGIDDLAHLRNTLASVIADAQAGKRWAGKGKSGRPSDESATDLMQMCFMIWTNFVQREFTVAWFKSQPDSDAARFCCDVAAIVDPKLSASRIITATRKVRENDINISDLGKLIAEADEFRKRLD